MPLCAQHTVHHLGGHLALCLWAANQGSPSPACPGTTTARRPACTQAQVPVLTPSFPPKSLSSDPRHGPGQPQRAEATQTSPLPLSELPLCSLGHPGLLSPRLKPASRISRCSHSPLGLPHLRCLSSLGAMLLQAPPWSPPRLASTPTGRTTCQHLSAAQKWTLRPPFLTGTRLPVDSPLLLPPGQG